MTHMYVLTSNRIGPPITTHVYVLTSNHIGPPITTHVYVLTSNHIHVAVTLMDPLPHLIYKDNYRRLNMIGRERANRALIGCDSQ